MDCNDARTEYRQLNGGVWVIKVDQQSSIDRFQVGAVHDGVVVAMETEQVLGEGVRGGHSDVIVGVIESLQKARVDVVQTMPVQVSTGLKMPHHADPTSHANAKQLLPVDKVPALGGVAQWLERRSLAGKLTSIYT